MPYFLIMNTQLEISAFLKPFIDTYKFINDEWAYYFEKGLNDYIHTMVSKYYFTNTFMHRGEKVNFRGIYFPIKVKYKETITDMSDLDGILSSYAFITLVGSAGSGKSTLIKYIFLRSIELSYKIPILIELRNLNNYDGNLEELINEKAFNSNFVKNKRTLQKALKSGKFLFLLDGFDEIYSDRKQKIIADIDHFVDKYSKNNYILTTRPGGGVENFSHSYDFKVLPLQSNEIEEFVRIMISNPERQNQILKSINGAENADYTSFLENPLLLSMFLLSFESHPEIPRKKSTFYSNVFDTLYSKHDGITKNSFPREKLTKLEKSEFENILNLFSFLTLSRGIYMFEEDLLEKYLQKVCVFYEYRNLRIEDLIFDLRTTLSIIILDGLEYNFPHRSMQEYFSAKFITTLPSNRKKNAYQSIISDQDELSSDFSRNFWNISKELDESSFFKYFILPSLKTLSRKLKHNQLERKVKAFLNSFLLVLDSENEIEIGGVVYSGLFFYRYSTFNATLLLFMDLLDWEDLLLFPQKTTHAEYIKKYYLSKKGKQPKSNPFFIELKIDSDTEKFLLSSEFENLIDRTIESIEKCIGSLEVKLSKKSDNLDSILTKVQF